MRHLACGILLLCMLLAVPAPCRHQTASSQTGCAPISGRTPHANGVSADTFNAAFAGISPNLQLPDLVRPGEEARVPQAQHQAEFGQPSAYFSEKHRDGHHEWADASAPSAMPPSFSRSRNASACRAAWCWPYGGRESAFGNASIPHNAIEVLGTKAFMARRRDMFRAEILAALVMLERGYATVGQMKSSWAGALGQPQFLPTSYLQYAIAFDGEPPCRHLELGGRHAGLDRQLSGEPRMGAGGVTGVSRSQCRVRFHAPWKGPIEAVLSPNGCPWGCSASADALFPSTNCVARVF